MRLARIDTPTGPRPVVQDGDVWAVVVDHHSPDLERTGETHPVDGARLLAPCEPRVVLGMAHNSGPADRLVPPQAFTKSARTVVGPGEPVQLDPAAGKVVVEGELAIVIGRTARHLTPEQVPGVILGWTVGNDVTAYEQSALDDKFTQSKNGDGFTPLGPWIETDLAVAGVADLAIDVQVDGATEAKASTSGLAWDVVEQLVYLTSHLTLGPGDVVLTGSPSTSAHVVPGQTSAITIEGIGTLTNPIV